MSKIFAVFSGQGAQAVGMGKDIYENCPSAKKKFDVAAKTLGDKILEVMFSGPEEELTSTKYCQPSIYTMSCACFDVWKEKNPEIAQNIVAAAGLSLGEYGAMYAAGVIDFETGLKLLAERSALMENACQNNPGSMASILKADSNVIKKCCEQADIDVANYNSPGQIVISGPEDKLKKAIELLKAAGVSKIIPLKVAGAFHSRLMQEAGIKFADTLKQCKFRIGTIPVYHNFTADAASSPDEIRELLAKQVSGSVRWEESLRRAVANGADTVVEFGPGSVLTGLARRTISDLKLFNINTLDSINQFNI